MRDNPQGVETRRSIKCVTSNGPASELTEFESFCLSLLTRFVLKGIAIGLKTSYNLATLGVQSVDMGSQRHGILDLPVELLCQIFHEIIPGSTTLKNLSLTCKYFQASAQRALFRGTIITVITKRQGLRLAARAKLSKPSEYVTNVQFSFSLSEGEETASIIDLVLAALPNTSSLSLRIKFGHHAQVASWLRVIKRHQLTELSIIFAHNDFVQEALGNAKLLEFKEMNQALRELSTLKVLNLYGAPGEMGSIRGLPKLNKLTLFKCDSLGKKLSNLTSTAKISSLTLWIQTEGDLDELTAVFKGSAFENLNSLTVENRTPSHSVLDLIYQFISSSNSPLKIFKYYDDFVMASVTENELPESIQKFLSSIPSTILSLRLSGTSDFYRTCSSVGPVRKRRDTVFANLLAGLDILNTPRLRYLELECLGTGTGMVSSIRGIQVLEQWAERRGVDVWIHLT